jgi:hypothetical protein
MSPSSYSSSHQPPLVLMTRNVSIIGINIDHTTYNIYITTSIVANIAYGITQRLAGYIAVMVCSHYGVLYGGLREVFSNYKGFLQSV